MSIARVYRLTAATGQQQALFEALNRLVTLVRPLAGCQGVELLMNLQQPGAYLFIERWASVEAHRSAAPALPREAFAPLMRAVAQPPEVTVLDALVVA